MPTLGFEISIQESYTRSSQGLHFLNEVGNQLPMHHVIQQSRMLKLWAF